MGKLLAVYGSLRPDAPDLRTPSVKGMVHLGRCRIPGQLYVAYGYPALKRIDGVVAGDLFKVPALFDFAALDAFEDYYPKHPHECWYLRRRVLLHEPRVWAWVYYYMHKVDRRAHIRSGDWVEFRNRGSSGVLAHGER